MALEIVEQHSCFRESILDNGDEVDIHYVVKKTPFAVALRVSDKAKIDFKTGTLRCELIYDIRNEHKDVIVPDGGPALTFTAHPSADGKECSVDVRLYMLTTQANGIRFLIQFTLAPKAGVGAALVTDSSPIVVVSKQQQIRNKEAEVLGDKEPNNARSRKRVRQEDVYGVLDEILTLQRATVAQMAALQGAGASSAAPLRKIKAEPQQSSTLSVEQAMQALVQAYRREALVSGLQRPSKIRRLVESSDVATQSELKEIGFALTHAEFLSHGELNLSADASSSPLAQADEPHEPHYDAMALSAPAAENYEHWTPLESHEDF